MTPDKQSLETSDLAGRRNHAMVNRARALLWMNGGGAVALAFLQAIWGENPGFSRSILRASVCFLIGVLLAGSVSVVRSAASLELEDEGDSSQLHQVYLFAACGSLLAFIAGVVAVVWGGYQALQ
jgi:hypothetical protein